MLLGRGEGWLLGAEGVLVGVGVRLGRRSGQKGASARSDIHCGKFSVRRTTKNAYVAE